MSFNIKALWSIELSNQCNLRCVYCPQPKMKRPKIHMTWEIFNKCVEWGVYFRDHGIQTEFSLYGTGESTLHPDLREMMAVSRDAFGFDFPILLMTNGIEVVKRPEMIDWFLESGISVGVSLHRPEKAGRAIAMLKEAGCLFAVSPDASTNTMNWAGQVDWPVTTAQKGQTCMFLKNRYGAVMSNGVISPCCFDAEGIGEFATVFDDLTIKETGPYSLCDTCHLKPPAEMLGKPIELRGFDNARKGTGI